MSHHAPFSHETYETTYKLVFSNLLNGVTVPAIAEAFRLSPDEVQKIAAHMMLKVRCYMHDRNMPTDRLDTIADAQRDRIMIHWVMDRMNILKPPRYKHFERIPIDRMR